MASARKEIQVFSVSFLDVICCAFGGTLLLLLVTLNREENRVRDISVVFVVDGTGSMGPTLDDIKMNIQGTVRVLQKLGRNLRIGFVLYRDQPSRVDPKRPPPPVIEKFDLDLMAQGNLERLVEFISALKPNGGYDTAAESVGLGLETAEQMNWPAGGKRYIVVVGDAHADDPDKAFAVARRFGNMARGHMVSAINCRHDRSSAKESEVSEFMQQLAEAGSGQYTRSRGQILESIMLAILDGKSGGG